MLPVGNRPIVDYIVEDCRKAGITDIIFVVGEQSSQIRTYYGQNPLLEAYLSEHHADEKLREVRETTKGITCTFVTQDANQPYGTSIPLWLARDFISPGERFLFLYGDNIYRHKQQDGSTVADFLAAAQAAGTPAAMLVAPVPYELVSRYGVVAMTKQDNFNLYQKIVEKPKPEDAPSNLNNTGCFLLDSAIFPYVKQSIEDSPQEEKYVIDAVNWYSDAGNKIAVIETESEYLDCGTQPSWLHANNQLARD